MKSDRHTFARKTWRQRLKRWKFKWRTFFRGILLAAAQEEMKLSREELEHQLEHQMETPGATRPRR